MAAFLILVVLGGTMGAVQDERVPDLPARERRAMRDSRRAKTLLAAAELPQADLVRRLAGRVRTRPSVPRKV